MDKIVIDSNKIFSMLLSNNVKTREFLFADDKIFYAPNFLFLEIFRLKEKILKFTKLSDGEFTSTFNIIFERINFIGRNYISDSYKQKALSLCADIDEADTPFVALALQIRAKIWTGDNILKKGLINKGVDIFVD
jgi:predicted nucleic acid-binding protein